MEADLELWRYWGFEPWERDGFRGVSRRVTFLKGALLGVVARYYAEDHIVWSCLTDGARESLWNGLSRKEDVMTQRFLFLTSGPPRRVKAFGLGFGGYAEFLFYVPSDDLSAPAKPHRRARDLTGLVDRAIELGRDAQEKK